MKEHLVYIAIGVIILGFIIAFIIYLNEKTETTVIGRIGEIGFIKCDKSCFFENNSQYKYEIISTYKPEELLSISWQLVRVEGELTRYDYCKELKKSVEECKKIEGNTSDICMPARIGSCKGILLNVTSIIPVCQEGFMTVNKSCTTNKTDFNCTGKIISSKGDGICGYMIENIEFIKNYNNIIKMNASVLVKGKVWEEYSLCRPGAFPQTCGMPIKNIRVDSYSIK